MRYALPIYFVSKEKPIRLPNGDWSEGIETKVLKYANISDMGDETKMNVFGNVTAQGLVIRIQNDYTSEFGHIEINGIKYRVLRKKTFRHDAVFEVGEADGL